MLARRSTLHHPSGAAIDLPRLVPAFTSKGFPFIVNRRKGSRSISEANDALKLAAPVIVDSILISAYDIYFGHFVDPLDHLPGKGLVFIDSGGYELSDDFDSTEAKVTPIDRRIGYNLDSYITVLRRLPSDLPIVITNFDHLSKRKKITDQVMEAQRLFARFGQFAHDFIIKPEGKKAYIDIEGVENSIRDFGSFQIIGVTEKELGSSVADKMESIGRLRMALDRHLMNQPIHIWGGLDPVMTLLYFVSGAEIFDGVSWLRYGYYNDVAISREAYGAIESGVQAPRGRTEAIRLAKNISYLENLTARMKRFVDKGGEDFSEFGKVETTIRVAYDNLRTRLRLV
jgi:hypothetical protein